MQKVNCHCRVQSIGVFFLFFFLACSLSHTWFLPVYWVLKALIVCFVVVFFTPFHLKIYFFLLSSPLYAHVTP